MLSGCSDSGTSSQVSASTSGNSYSCTGIEKEKADRVAIDAFNWGYALGLGLAVDPNELDRIQRASAQLTPACQRYVEEIGARLTRMKEAGEIRDRIDRIPF